MTDDYASPAPRARVVLALLALVVVVNSVAVVSDLAEVRLLERAATPPGITFAEADASDLRQGRVEAVQIVLYVAVAGFFVAWLHRMYRNAVALAPPAPRYAVGWTIGAWFVPVWNLFRPKQLVNDVWHSARPQAGRAVPLLLAVWWGGWIAGLAILQISLTLSSAAETLTQTRTASQWLAVADGYFAALAVLAFLVVRALTNAQQARVERGHA